MSADACWLLTGASGVVGQAILREWRRRPSGRLLAMSHRSQFAAEGVECFSGDVTQPNFGLDRASYERLTRRVRAVIHSAAITEWGLDPGPYSRVNLRGTENVLELCRAAAAPLYYMSTAFVAARGPSARFALSPQNVVFNYIGSKRAAEQAILDSDVPHCILRPTNLIGDSDTAESSRPQIVQSLSEWILRGKASVLPAAPGNRVDVVPQDVLARVTLALLQSGTLGEQHWITYGERAMSPERAVELCLIEARRAGLRLREPRILRPDAIDWASLTPIAQRYVRVLCDVSEVTECSGGALPSTLESLQSRYGMKYVSDEIVYQRGLGVWASSLKRASSQPGAAADPTNSTVTQMNGDEYV